MAKRKINFDRKSFWVQFPFWVLSLASFITTFVFVCIEEELPDVYYILATVGLLVGQMGVAVIQIVLWRKRNKRLKQLPRLAPDHPWNEWLYRQTHFEATQATDEQKAEYLCFCLFHSCASGEGWEGFYKSTVSFFSVEEVLRLMQQSGMFSQKLLSLTQEALAWIEGLDLFNFPQDEQTAKRSQMFGEEYWAYMLELSDTCVLCSVGKPSFDQVDATLCKTYRSADKRRFVFVYHDEALKCYRCTELIFCHDDGSLSGGWTVTGFGNGSFYDSLQTAINQNRSYLNDFTEE